MSAPPPGRASGRHPCWPDGRYGRSEGACNGAPSTGRP